MTLTPVADERGWLQYWVSSRRDISERAEAALALSELTEALKTETTARSVQAMRRSTAQDVAKHLHEMRSV
jgi:hypothetical protein